MGKASFLLSGECLESQAADILSDLFHRGETVQDLIEFAKAMRQVMIPVSLSRPALDSCGSGGSGKSRFNVSTASSFILAADGIPVAKHGNRGSKSPNGSFDFLEALGIPYYQDPLQAAAQFNRFGICFLFARHYHPMVGKLAPVRAKLGHPTIFNLLGPLCNPASVPFQIIGTPSLEKARLLASALVGLGIQKGVVLCGGDQRDELSLTAPSTLFLLENSALKDVIIFDPTSLNLPPIRDEDLSCLDAAVSAELFLHLLLSRTTDHPISYWMFLNSGLAFWMMGISNSILEGFNHSRQVFLSGAVLNLIRDLQEGLCKAGDCCEMPKCKEKRC